MAVVALSLPGTSGGNTPIYGNPFRMASVTPERIDMGVDYAGKGPIFAPGPGIITEADQAWAGGYGGYPGTYIVEKITEGPLAGRSVYFAEGINPTVRKGQRVTADSVIGTIIPGSSTGIETGFAHGTGGETEAQYYG